MTDALLRRVVWALVLLLVAAAWWGSLDAPFVYDDKIEVVGNRTIRWLENWRAIGAYNVSRPLLVFSYAWNFDRFGFDPWGYHATNLAVHAAAVGTALAMVEGVGRLFGVTWTLARAAAVVALWAVHPMVTESVTYTTGRSETLCAAFAFAAVAAWARALEAEREGETAWHLRVLGIVSVVGSVASKEVGVVVPAILAALEWGALGAAGVTARARLLRARWAWLGAFVVLVAAAATVKLSVVGQLIPREVDRGLAVQATTSAEVWRHTLRLWVLPVGQTLFHDQPDVAPLGGRGLLAWAGWLGMLGVGASLGWRRPVVGFALAAAALTLVPSTSLVMLKEHMAEHRSYQAGLFLLAAVGLGLPERWLRGGATVAVIALPVLIFASRARNAVWGSEVALWEEATRRSPASAEAWYGLGDAHRFAKDFDQAVIAYERAAALDPDDLDTWNNLGIAWAEVGEVERARRAWRSSLEVRPSYCKAHNNLGSLAYRFKDWDDARTELQSTLAYCPDDPIAHYLLGNIYYGPRRDPERALVHYERVVRVAPEFDHIQLVKERILELTW